MLTYAWAWVVMCPGAHRQGYARFILMTFHSVGLALLYLRHPPISASSRKRVFLVMLSFLGALPPREALKRINATD